MNHYGKSLSAFINRELPKEDRQEIAEHLLRCEKCRHEHDQIKLGAMLAGRLEPADAPANMWDGIAKSLDAPTTLSLSLLQANRLEFKHLAAAFAAVVIVAGLAAVVYLNLFRDEEKNVATVDQPPVTADGPRANPDANVVVEPSRNVNSITETKKEQIAAQQPVLNVDSAPAIDSWHFETIAGAPKVGSSSGDGKLAVGDFLKTDGASRARITVANIGNVEIAPNSLVKLVNTTPVEHRLYLEHGALHAKILAPPRLFIVDTPSAVAVDLGCEYNLEVDKQGNSKLHVTSGFVALERGGRESIVPAGAMCLTKKGKGLGTPFSTDASADFQVALMKFDFANGGSDAVETMIRESTLYDMITFWHLLSRVQKQDRGLVFDALAKYVGLPPGVTREGILKLDRTMLDAWREEVEKIWFE